MKNVRLTNTFYKKKNYKLMWYNMIGYNINLNFEKLNYIMPHEFADFFYFIFYKICL
jgi:hypothetical protein